MSVDQAPAGGLEPISLGDVSAEAGREWLEAMVLIRQFESACDALVKSAQIVGAIHSSIGQEAIAVGAARALRSGDVTAATHRSHHHALAMGLPPERVMAELFGRATGVAGGRGGSMHLTDLERGFIGGDGVVGGGLGVAMGAALGASLQGRSTIAIGFIGDGGMNTGRTWETVNLASVWLLPLVILVENNLYAVETSTLSLTGGGSISERARGFGLPVLTIDGQDPVAVHAAVIAARARAVAGEGPTFIEALTYRYEGHNTGQIMRYRDAAEVIEWRDRRDPIERLRHALQARGMLADQDFAAISERVRATVDGAVAFAEASPWPEPSAALFGVTGTDLRMPGGFGR